MAFLAYTLMNLSDVYRNFYIGLGNYTSAVVIEIIGLFVSIFSGWLFGLYLELGFWGIMLA